MLFPICNYTRLVIFLGMALLFVMTAGFSAPSAAETNRIIVDNFEKPGKKNLRGGEFGAFGDPNGIGQCYLFFSQIKDAPQKKSNKYALYIQWNTAKSGAFGGYWTQLMNLDLEKSNYLTFLVKGSRGGEKFKVGLRGDIKATHETKVHINKALSKGVTTQWQMVKMPLKWFKIIENWHHVNVLSINFEYEFGSGDGSIWIDEVAFE